MLDMISSMGGLERWDAIPLPALTWNFRIGRPMENMNFCQGFWLIVFSAPVLLAILITKPWEAPKDNRQRWVRSLWTGFSAAISTIFLVSLAGLGQSTGNCLNDIQILNISYWACIGIPVFIVATCGRYFSYRQIIWLHSIRERNERKKK